MSTPRRGPRTPCRRPSAAAVTGPARAWSAGSPAAGRSPGSAATVSSPTRSIHASTSSLTPAASSIATSLRRSPGTSALRARRVHDRRQVERDDEHRATHRQHPQEGAPLVQGVLEVGDGERVEAGPQRQHDGRRIRGVQPDEVAGDLLDGCPPGRPGGGGRRGGGGARRGRCGASPDHPRDRRVPPPRRLPRPSPPAAGAVPRDQTEADDERADGEPPAAVVCRCGRRCRSSRGSPAVTVTTPRAAERVSMGWRCTVILRSSWSVPLVGRGSSTAVRVPARRGSPRGRGPRPIGVISRLRGSNWKSPANVGMTDTPDSLTTVLTDDDLVVGVDHRGTVGEHEPAVVGGGDEVGHRCQWPDVGPAAARA